MCKISQALRPSVHPEGKSWINQAQVKGANLRHICVHVLLEVHREELKDEVELGLLHEHILQGYNIRVLQLFQQGDLADCC